MNNSLPERLDALRPTYRCSFPYEKHPKGDEVAARVREYFATEWPWPSNKAKEDYLRMEVEPAVSLFLPRTEDHLLESASLWFSLYFLLDDMMEQVSIEGQKMSNIIPLTLGDAKPTPGDQLEAVIYDIHHRCRTAGDQAAAERFQILSRVNAKWMKCVLSLRQEAKLFQLGTHADFDSFLKERISEVGASVLFPLARWTCNIPLSDDIVAHPDIQAIEEIASIHATYINDLYSLRKELKEVAQKKDAGIKIICPNVILFLAKNDGMTAPEAMENVQGRLRGLEHDFLGVAERLLEPSAEARLGETSFALVKKFVDNMSLFMAGNIAWSERCGRYNDVY